MKAAEMRSLEKVWKDAYFRTEQFDFDDTRGPGWVSKKDLLANFGKIQNLSSLTAILDRYTKAGSQMMDTTNEGRRKYLRLKQEHRKQSASGNNE